MHAWELKARDAFMAEKVRQAVKQGGLGANLFLRGDSVVVKHAAHDEAYQILVRIIRSPDGWKADEVQIVYLGDR